MRGSNELLARVSPTLAQARNGRVPTQRISKTFVFAATHYDNCVLVSGIVVILVFVLGFWTSRARTRTIDLGIKNASPRLVRRFAQDLLKERLNGFPVKLSAGVGEIIMVCVWNRQPLLRGWR